MLFAAVYDLLGYVRAYKPELKFKDYDIYKGVYCTLCKQLMRDYSPFAQLFLSYDMCFFAITLMSLVPQCPSVKKSRCCYNPLKACHSCGADTASMRFCATVSVIMGYYKLRDNLTDRGFFRRLAACLLLPVASLMHKKAKRLEPQAEEIVSHAMTEQANAEKNVHCGCDEAAEPSARALSLLANKAGNFFADGEDAENSNAELFGRLGYLLGRFVYIIDAVDDLSDDIKKDNFNPLKAKYRELSACQDTQSFYDYAQRLLNQCIGECVNTFEKMKLIRFNDIVYNVLFDGLYNSALLVLKRTKGEAQA